MGYKDHLTTQESNAKRQYKETKSSLASSFVASPVALTENVTDSGIHIKAPTATQDFLQPLLMEIDNQVTNVATVIEVALDKITAGFHRIQLPDVPAVTINFLDCPLNRVVDFFLDFTKENVANTPTVTFNQTVNGLTQADLDNNDRILVPIAARDTQDEVRLDAYGVNGGGGGGFANQFLSNLLSPTSINQDLLFSVIGFDIGSTLVPVQDIFVGRVRLQPAAITVNVPNITASIAGSMLLNVETGASFLFHEQGVQTFGMSPSTFSGPNIILTGSLNFNDSALDPTLNGEMRRNVADVKVFSGGAVRNLSNIGAAGGANVFLSNLTSPTSINQDLLFSATGFDIGATINPVQDIFVERVRLQASAITVNVPMITANVGGDMLLNVDTNDNFIFHEAGVPTFSMSDTLLSGPSFLATLSFALNDSATVPAVNGLFTRDGADVKVFSGGAVRNLSDIVAGGGNEFADNLFRINDNIDPTRQLAFQTGGISTATLRTWTAQDASGTVALLDSGVDQVFSTVIRPSNNGIIDWGSAAQHLNQLFTEQITYRGVSGPASGATKYSTADSDNFIWNTTATDGFIWKQNNANVIEAAVDGTEMYLRAGTGKVMGFVVTDATITLGSLGSLVIPDDTAGAPGTAAQADIDFGDETGCMGIYSNSTTNVHVLVVRQSDGNWAGIVLANNTLV